MPNPDASFAIDYNCNINTYSPNYDTVFSERHIAIYQFAISVDKQKYLDLDLFGNLKMLYKIKISAS